LIGNRTYQQLLKSNIQMCILQTDMYAYRLIIIK